MKRDMIRKACSSSHARLVLQVLGPGTQGLDIAPDDKSVVASEKYRNVRGP